ncbi:MAG: hypothetical protein HDR82_02915 [Bacteroides sp.]|nr:hypothetical protein [Bacteroides sp.]
MKKHLLHMSIVLAAVFTASAQTTPSIESPDSLPAQLQQSIVSAMAFFSSAQAIEMPDTMICPGQLIDGAPGEIIITDSLSAYVVTPEAPHVKPGIEPIKHFTWGIDAGSAIDLTGKDMSAIDISAYFGYSGPYLRFVGVGAAIDMMVSSSSSSYPVFAMLRTDFKRQHQLCFLEARGGIAFSNINNFETQSTPFGSLGVGITLATGRTFSSHILLSYNYTKLNDVVLEEGSTIRIHDLQYASIKIGISF